MVDLGLWQDLLTLEVRQDPLILEVVARSSLILGSRVGHMSQSSVCLSVLSLSLSVFLPHSFLNPQRRQLIITGPEVLIFMFLPMFSCLFSRLLSLFTVVCSSTWSWARRGTMLAHANLTLKCAPMLPLFAARLGAGHAESC